MMGAGGFIKNPGWEIFSSDDLMDEDDIYVDSVVENFLNDGDEMDLNTEVLVYFPASDDDSNEDDFGDIDIDNEEDDDDDDEDYVPSDSFESEDFDGDAPAIPMGSGHENEESGDESVPELSN